MSFPPVNASSADAPTIPPRGFVLGPDDGDPYYWLGSLTLNKVSPAASRGGFDIVDHRVPRGYAPPRHVHLTQDEVFYLIDGQLKVQCGSDVWEAGPGSLVFLPRGIAHGFTVSDAGPARTLLINAPAGFADMIVELGTPATALALPGDDVPLPDPARLAAVFQAHGITVFPE
jgi:quercetin dioxygenase-like cupin family protein